MPPQKAENPLANILINIILPVIVLNKGGKWFAPHTTLLLALVFPLGYGIYDYARNHHKNYVSLLGVVNTLLTGGLAMLNLQGIWFAVKEASLPLILGAMVLASRFTDNPAARLLFCNPQVMNLTLVEERLREFNRQTAFERLIKRTTIWLSFSFIISAVLNFVIAFNIFVSIDPSLNETARQSVLNEQIAQMTWMGMVAIALPLMAFSMVLIYIFLRRLSQLTETPIQQLLNN